MKIFLEQNEVCSSYLGLHDNDRRLADHFGGKLHLGFIDLRNRLQELEKYCEEHKEEYEKKRATEKRSRSRSRFLKKYYVEIFIFNDISLAIKWILGRGHREDVDHDLEAVRGLDLVDLTVVGGRDLGHVTAVDIADKWFVK